jgi:hypothetical protein
MVARAENTFSSELGRRLQKEWGINETCEAKIHVTLGYPIGGGQPKSKQENRIKRII